MKSNHKNNRNTVTQFHSNTRNTSNTATQLCQYVSKSGSQYVCVDFDRMSVSQKVGMVLS